MLNDPSIEENWSDVTLLLTFDTDFIDSKNSINASDVIGAPTITKSATETKFGGCVQFNGVEDKLRYQNDEDTRIGTGDFTIEFWIYPKRFGSAGGGAVGNVRGIFANNTIYSTASNSRTLIIKLDSDDLSLEVAGIAVGSSIKIGVYDWTHVAVSRIGTDLMFFVDGELVHTYINATYDFSSNNFVIGAANVSSFAHFYGNVDDFRFTKGVGRYSESFPIPTSAYPIGNTKPKAVNYFPMVRLLGAYGSVDSSYNQYNLNINRPPTRNTEVPFIDGSPSLYFHSSFIATPYSSDFRLGANDFTIEAWVNTNNSGNRTICASYGYPVRGNFWFGLVGDTLRVRRGDGSSDSRYLRSEELFTFDGSYVGRIPANTWCHVAWTRKSGVNRLFINGVIAKTFGNGTNWTSSVITMGASAFRMSVYRQSNLSSWWDRVYVEQNHFLGSMNDVKVSNLVCKYTSNFDPYLEYPLNRPRDTSLFNDANVEIGHFDPVIMSEFEIDNKNNNIFWFNDGSGFVLQKPANTVPGVWITNATINASNELVITTSNGTVQNLGTIFNTSVQSQVTATGTGNLTTNGGTELTFNPITTSGDLVIQDSPSRQTLTTNKIYDAGTSVLGWMRAGVYVEPGTSFTMPATNSVWTTQNLNTVATNIPGASLNNSQITLPPGTYYAIINTTGYFAATCYHAWRLYNNTTLQDIVRNNSDFYVAGWSPTSQMEKSFILNETTNLSLQVFVLSTTSSALTVQAAAGAQPFQQLTIFKVA